MHIKSQTWELTKNDKFWIKNYKSIGFVIHKIHTNVYPSITIWKLHKRIRNDITRIKACDVELENSNDSL